MVCDRLGGVCGQPHIKATAELLEKTQVPASNKTSSQSVEFFPLEKIYSRLGIPVGPAWFRHGLFSGKGGFSERQDRAVGLILIGEMGEFLPELSLNSKQRESLQEGLDDLITLSTSPEINIKQWSRAVQSFQQGLGALRDL